jgi:anti-sigma regulatory factor (Ser/Thr protein kinase)
LTALQTAPDEPFCHEAFLYAGEDGFVDGAAAFLREGIDAGEPSLVVVASHKIDLLRQELGVDAEAVCFADMADVGANPARIIHAWQEFLAEHGAGGQPVRGIGEPIWAGRTADELVEAQRHEVLLNVAFEGTGPWVLMCPYDVTSLAEDVVREAARSHPMVRDGTGRRASAAYQALADGAFTLPLAPPPAEAADVPFGVDALDSLRSLVWQFGRAAGVARARLSDLVLAVNEVATNSLRYGGGGGVLRLWEADGAVICEVTDAGRITDPLIGRVQPRVDREGGRGLWLANQLCDLVQIRSFEAGSVVRLHQRVG